MADKKNAAPIGDVLKNVLSRLEKEKNLSKEEMETLWRELAGEAGFKHSRPTVLRKGVLTVRVDTSTWLHEFVMRKREFLKGLKRALGKDRISELQFKIGEV